MRRSVLAKILLSAALFLVISEVGLRWRLDRAKVPHGADPATYFAAMVRNPANLPLPPREPSPERGFRLFLLGDSTALGYPYSLFVGPGAVRVPEGAPSPSSPTALSFGHFLAEGLRAATGTPIVLDGFTVGGRNSAGLLVDLDLALATRPDLLVVYIGHNEFTERISQIGPYGRTRHGALDLVFAGWHDFLRGLRVGIRTRRAERVEGMPAAFATELSTAARFLALGDPEARLPENLPMEPGEIALHLDRYEANVRRLVARVRAAGVRLVLVEPASSLLAAPMASGRLWDGRAQRAWDEGMAALARDPATARARLLDARDLDPAPIRLARPGLERLRRAALDTPRVVLDDGGLEERFVDPVHPSAELATVFAERIALALPFADAPRLAPGDGAALARFRAAIGALIESPELRAGIAAGNAVGVSATAYTHMHYGNRGAAEATVRRVPEAARDFRMTMLLDLLLRWRGARDEADALLTRAAGRRPEWSPALEWWRRRVGRA